MLLGVFGSFAGSYVPYMKSDSLEVPGFWGNFRGISGIFRELVAGFQGLTQAFSGVLGGLRCVTCSLSMEV